MSETCRPVVPPIDGCRRTALDLTNIVVGSLLVWLASTCALTAPANAAPRSRASTAPVQVGVLTVHATPQPPTALAGTLPGKIESGEAVVDARIKALGYDPANIRDAIAAYRAGHLETGDALSASIANAPTRAALEWVGLRNLPPAAGLDRLQGFIAAHPSWAGLTTLRHQVEARLLPLRNPEAAELFFATRAPETAIGKLALAQALKQTGRAADGTRLARAVFREHDLTPYLEGWLRAEFGDDLTRGDYKYRGDRFLYAGRSRLGLRNAAIAGSQVLALATARVAVTEGVATDKAIAAVPEDLRADPGLVLAEVHRLRRAKMLVTAARLLQTVVDPNAQRIDADAWWTERRVLARELLDANKPKAAYITCAMHPPSSGDTDVEAEFHAGWIALRFLQEPERAAYHFWVAAKHAQSPSAIARIAYWQGRTAEASDDPESIVRAKAFYEKAALRNATYYGQLARQALGLPVEIVRAPTIMAVGEDRAESIRATELLYAAGEKDSADALALDAAQTLTDEAQIAALSAVIAAQQDAHLSLTIGTTIAQRGISVDPLAYPAFGIPAYQELANSASQTVVYSVARQESAFLTHAVSGAHANGLMQMLDATARQTAVKAGLPFSHARLLHDAAFNAQLGAAHLGTLMSEHKGSLILTFAAYNAGGGRVKEWIDAYGDPRREGVDPIDWVERIPFTETRNYVQRVMANVAVYTAIFAEKARTDAIAKRGREARL